MFILHSFITFIHVVRYSTVEVNRKRLFSSFGHVAHKIVHMLKGRGKGIMVILEFWTCAIKNGAHTNGSYRLFATFFGRDDPADQSRKQ